MASKCLTLESCCYEPLLLMNSLGSNQPCPFYTDLKIFFLGHIYSTLARKDSQLPHNERPCPLLCRTMRRRFSLNMLCYPLPICYNITESSRTIQISFTPLLFFLRCPLFFCFHLSLLGHGFIPSSGAVPGLSFSSCSFFLSPAQEPVPSASPAPPSHKREFLPFDFLTDLAQVRWSDITVDVH